MITLAEEKNKSISQEIYDTAISSIYFFNLICPSCGHGGCLTGHGHYLKRILTETERILLRVQRVICTCGATHAIFLPSMVPGSSLPVEVCREISKHGAGQKTVVRLQLRFPEISESAIRYAFRQFRRHWEQRLLSFAIPLSDPSALLQGCFAHFSRQFMQIKNWPNILFSPPT